MIDPSTKIFCQVAANPVEVMLLSLKKTTVNLFPLLIIFEGNLKPQVFKTSLPSVSRTKVKV